MKIRDLFNDDGVLIGFEVINLLLTRSRVCSIAAEIPGVVVTRWPRWFVWWEDVFCEFELDGVGFHISEPPGGTSCYWIVASAPSEAKVEILRVREAFATARPWALR